VADRLQSPQGKALTDMANAERFATRYSARTKYIYAWKAYVIYDDRRWARDATGTAERQAKDTLRDLIAQAADLGDEKEREALIRHALASSSDRGVRAILSLARSETEIALTPDRFDADPWLLNVANGTIDLRSGTLRSHQAADYLMALTPTVYEPNAPCPQWERFLSEIMGGDADLMAFLARAVGYSLTGDTREQVLFFCHGSGQNGKTVFLETLADVVGPDYAAAAAFSTFLTQRRDGAAPSPDVARLRGARFVTASEAPGTRPFDESLVKELTGSDTVPARFLHENPFEFRPAFKLWLRANHRPPVREQTVAFWRRMRLVPFGVTIPEERRDRDLGGKLLAERAGILAWAVRGCLDWQRHGLGEPAAVRQATETYREENDVLGEFLDARCALDPNAWTATSALYLAFTAWWEKSHGKHEPPLTSRWFGRALGERADLRAEPRGHANVRGWGGVRLVDGDLLPLGVQGEEDDDLPF